jgi:hypothetical protein
MKTVCELIHQVQLSARGSVETEVRTIISRPMWRLWNRELGDPEDSEPTEWLGIKDTNRVYGSETIVVESDALFSFSFLRP